LFAAEEAQYLEEAASSNDSLAQRIAKMRQKAKRIREEKDSDIQNLFKINMINVFDVIVLNYVNFNRKN